MIYKVLTLASLVISAIADVVPVTRYGPLHETIKDQYIVRFHPDADQEFAAFQAKRLLGGDVHFNKFSDYMGFSATLSDEELAMVQRTPGVLSIEPNAIVRAFGEQSDPTWGLDRVDQRNRPLNKLYKWNDDTDGSDADVHVFVLDTGILTTIDDFGERALFAADCLGISCDTTTNTMDQNGHGTHCAGTVASATYGVAKGVTVHNVRCLDARGNGSIRSIINAWEFVVNSEINGTKIISASLGGGRNSAMNAAVDSAYSAGILSVIAAGNFNSDACTNSPASADTAFTVASSNINDVKARTSCWGRCVQLYAPGELVTSWWNNGQPRTISGTSMACPHVAGAAAMIASRGVTSPKEITDTLIREATPDVISNNPTGTPNLLLFTSPN